MRRQYALARTSSSSSSSSFASFVMAPAAGANKLRLLQSHIPVGRLSFRYPKKSRRGETYISPPLESEGRRGRKLSVPAHLELSGTAREGSVKPLLPPESGSGHRKLSRAPPLRFEDQRGVKPLLSRGYAAPRGSLSGLSEAPLRLAPKFPAKNTCQELPVAVRRFGFLHMLSDSKRFSKHSWISVSTPDKTGVYIVLLCAVHASLHLLLYIVLGVLISLRISF